MSIEPKIDGIGIELTYKGGVLALGATRGDGRIGEDVTANVRDGARRAAASCASRSTIVVRGEIYMTKAEFAAINAERAKAGEELFKNPRNTAAGTIKQMDPREVAKRPMRTILYEVVDGERYARGHLASLDCIRRARPADVAAQPRRGELGRADRVRRSWQASATSCRTRSTAWSSRSTTSRSAPRSAPRRSFRAGRSPTSSRRARSRRLLRDLEPNIGRTGVVTPVAVLEPVDALGHHGRRARRSTTGTRCSGSASASGDRVLIEKAGEIIPQILAVTERARARRSTHRRSARRAAPARARGGQGRAAVHQPARLPGAAARRDRVLRVARPDEHRRARREGRRASWSRPG